MSPQSCSFAYVALILMLQFQTEMAFARSDTSVPETNEILSNFTTIDFPLFSNVTTGEKCTIDSFALEVVYEWNINANLRLATTFLASTYGYDCQDSYNSSYVDEILRGSFGSFSETIRVRVGDAYTDGQWMDQVDVLLAADWSGTLQANANIVISPSLWQRV